MPFLLQYEGDILEGESYIYGYQLNENKQFNFYTNNFVD